MMICQCRNCHKEYDNQKARGEYTGFCSARCQHEKAKELGYRRSRGGKTEYQILSNAKCIGDVPSKSERVKLRSELTDLESSLYGSKSRIAQIKRLLATEVQ